MSNNKYFQSTKTGKEIDQAVESVEILKKSVETIESDVKNLKDTKADKSFVPKKTGDLVDNTTQHTYDAKSTSPQSGQAVAQAIAQLIGSAPETLDTLEELADALKEDKELSATIIETLSKKVDKVEGKGLSSNDFTDEDKRNLEFHDNVVREYTEIKTNIREHFMYDTNFNITEDDSAEVESISRLSKYVDELGGYVPYTAKLKDTKAREMLDNISKAGVDKTVNSNYITIDNAIIGSSIEVETEIEQVSYCGNNLVTNDAEKVVKTISFAGKNTAIYSGSPKCVIVRCKPNTTYSVKKFENLGNVFRVISTAEKPEVGVMPLTYNEGTTEIQVTTPSDANWLAIMVANSTYKDPIENVLNITMCVESAEMPTEHEPFVGGTIDVVDGKCEVIANGTTNIFTENVDDILNAIYKIPIVDSVNTLNEKMAEIENQEYWKKQRMRFADEPVLVAYSDGGQLGYINALSAYLAAGVAGYKWLKGDVQPTSDGKLIMCHDNGFTFNANGYITTFDANNCTMIHTLTYNEAMSKEYTAWYGGYRMKVCDIEDYLKVCRDFNMRPYITIRDDHMDIVVPELLSMLEKYNFIDHCIVNSFNKESLRLVAEKSNHRVMISNVKFYSEGQQITVEHIQQILDISPNCTMCPYTNVSGYGTLLFENSAEALAFAKEQNIMLGTCAIGISPTAYYKYGINLFQCYNTWIDIKVTTIPLYIKLANGVATLESAGVYGDKYTATIEQNDNKILLKDIRRKNSERSYPDGILPHLRDRIPWSCNASGDIVKSCEYSDTYEIVITLNDGATDGDIYVKFVYGLETSSEDTETREELENKANVIIGISSGENINIKDSADAKFRGLKLFGKTKQVKTTGKNLLDMNNPEPSSNLSFEFANNTVKVTTSVGKGGSIQYIIGKYADFVGKQLTLSFDYLELSSSSSSSSASFNTFAQADITSFANVSTPKGNKGTLKFTVPENDSAENLVIRLYVGYVFAQSGDYIKIGNIQLEEGTSVTEFESYSGGKASPSPEYPQEMNSVGEDGSVEVSIRGKNLIPYLYNSNITISGVEVIDNGDGSLTLNGSTASVKYGLVAKASFPKNVPLTLSCKGLLGYEWNELSFQLQSFDASDTKINTTTVTQSDVSKTVTFSDNYSYSNIYICVGGNKEIHTTLFPMVAVGSTATEYEPRKELQSLITSTPNALPGIPVKSGGNYTDADGQQWVCDEIDLVRGKYIQRVTKVIFTGDEKFNLYNSTLHGALALTSVSKKIKLWGANQTKLLSNYFNDCVNGDNNGSTIQFYIAKNGIATVDAFKAFLKEKYNAGNPVVIIYPLAEPIETDLDLTPEEIAAYKELKTYKPVTNIYSDDGAGIEVEYVADTKTYIDNKFAELQTTILNAVM